MAKSVPALANPALLVWARESVGYEIPEVAEHLEIAETTVAAWERGEENPTIAQLRKVSALYKRPLAIFFLPQPPRAFDAMRYFRRHAGEAKPAPSPQMAILIRDAENRREIALELAEVLGETADPLSLRASIADHPGNVAAAARRWLGVPVDEQASWRDEYHAFRSWRAALERRGVLVFQVSRVSAEVRGFSIDADRFPVIAVSSKDSPRARIFSLFHELGHLILGRGELDEGGYWSRSDAVEVFCNEFAGQFLVPADALEEVLGPGRGAPATAIDVELVRQLVGRFSVSEEVILLRLVGLGRLERAAYEARRRELSQLEPRKPTKPIVSVPRRTVQALGGRYVRSVLAAGDARRITLSDVAGHLGVSLKHVPEIQRLLIAGEAA